MSSSRRHPLSILLAIMLPILLLLGLWLGGHPEDLPGFVRSAFVADQQTRVVDEAMQRIASDYYRPIPQRALSNASIAGAVASLHDRFSHYLTPSEYREFDAPPHFTGIGVSVGSEPRGLLVARVFNSSPASRAGLKPGDLIVAVDGRKLAGLSREAATGLIKGLPGTGVQLEVEAPESRTPGPRHDQHRQDHACGRVRAGRRIGHQDRPRRQARDRRAGHLQPGSAR